MLVNKSIETDEGTVVFEGVLEAKELDYVLQLGLNLLLQQGAIQHIVMQKEQGDVH